MTVADRIIKRRKELDITQDDLAKMLGLSGRSSVNKIEKSGNDITLKNIRRIAKALNCSVPYLMGYDEESNEESDDSEIKNPSNDHTELYDSLVSYIENFNDRQMQLLKSYIELLSKED